MAKATDPATESTQSNDAPAPKSAPTPAASPLTAQPWYRQPRLILALAALVVVLLAAAVVTHHRRQVARWDRPLDGEQGMMTHRFGPGHEFGSGGMHFGGRGDIQLQGVVTKVEGDTVTVAGGGKTNTIKVSPNTRYSGGSNVAVNDTVIVRGPLDGNTLSATQILVNP